MTEGNHFGEIALLYDGANRSAEIISRNYVTLATVSRSQLMSNISTDFPDFVVGLKQMTHRYNYPLKTFLLNIFKSTPILEQLSQSASCFHEALYRMKANHYDPFQYVAQEGSDIKSAFIV